MCSGDRSSSANGAIALRQSAASSWSTSSRRVLSEWTINGPSCITRYSGAGERAVRPLDRAAGRRYVAKDAGRAGGRRVDDMADQTVDTVGKAIGAGSLGF